MWVRCRDTNRRRFRAECLSWADLNEDGRINEHDEEQMVENFTCSDDQILEIPLVVEIPQSFPVGEEINLSLLNELGLTGVLSCPITFRRLSAVQTSDYGGTRRIRVPLSESGELRFTPATTGLISIQVELEKVGPRGLVCQSIDEKPTLLINIIGHSPIPTPTP